jgi:hypothetical protein
MGERELPIYPDHEQTIACTVYLQVLHSVAPEECDDFRRRLWRAMPGFIGVDRRAVIDEVQRETMPVGHGRFP